MEYGSGVVLYLRSLKNLYWKLNVMYCKESRKNGTCLDGDIFVVEGTINPPLPKHCTINGNLILCFIMDNLRHNSNSMHRSFYS